MIQIALDTSVLVGLLDPKDIWHEPAIALKEALQANFDRDFDQVTWLQRVAEPSDLA